MQKELVSVSKSNNHASSKGLQNNSDENTVKRSSKAYELNVDRNLSKKLAATKRAENLSVEEKDGGTVVTADAATSGLIKKAAVVLYNYVPPEKSHVKNRSH